MATAGTRRALSAATCSRISATSGEITSVRPSTAACSSAAGSWKAMLLPPPVGSTPSARSYSPSAWSSSRWPGRKAGCPKWVARADSSSKEMVKGGAFY